MYDVLLKFLIATRICVECEHSWQHQFAKICMIIIVCILDSPILDLRQKIFGSLAHSQLRTTHRIHKIYLMIKWNRKNIARNEQEEYQLMSINKQRTNKNYSRHLSICCLLLTRWKNCNFLKLFMLSLWEGSYLYSPKIPITKMTINRHNERKI